MAERFEYKKIYAGLYESVGLLAKKGSSFRVGGGAQWLNAETQRAYGAGHIGYVACCLACQTHTGDIDRVQLFRQTKGGESRMVGSESIGFENLGSRFHVLLVCFANERRRRKIQLVIAAVEENALGIQDRTHGAVGDHHPVLEPLAELFCPCDGDWWGGGGHPVDEVVARVHEAPATQA